MVKNNRFLLSVIFLIIGHQSIQAQYSFSTTSGMTAGSGGSVSYTIGQVAYQTHTALSGSVSEGVQQTFEISVVNSLELAKNIGLQCLAYPNPTTDYLQLKVESDMLNDLNYQLFDLHGFNQIFQTLFY